MLAFAQPRIAIIGGGKMGEAIMGGWIAAHEEPAASLTAAHFVVANPGLERRTYLADRYGVACVEDATLIDRADIVVLAVKPQVMMGVLESIANLPAFAGGAKGPLFVSIAAGLTTGRLEAALPENARLIRTMPNTPLLVADGATAVCAGSHVAKDDVQMVCELFACLGGAYEVDESSMDAVCALSGSGPAYIAALVEHLRDAGVRQGLDAQLAQDLALRTIHGTAELIRKTGQAPESVRQAVCSPGGTTLAALEAMNAAGLPEAYDAGVAAAVRRSKELAEC